MEPVALNSPIWILFLVSLILEILGLVIILICQTSICIAAYEASKGVMVFILFIVTAILPDLVFVISIFFMHDLGIEPLGIMYNFIIGIGCLAGSIVLFIMLTFCGNFAQFMILIAAILGLCSGIAHLVNGGIAHWLLPAEESYVVPRPKVVQKK